MIFKFTLLREILRPIVYRPGTKEMYDLNHHGATFPFFLTTFCAISIILCSYSTWL